jgi:hypothetical protein
MLLREAGPAERAWPTRRMILEHVVSLRWLAEEGDAANDVVIRRHARSASWETLGAELVAVVLGLLSCTAQFAAVARASDGIDPETARALLDFSSLTFVLMWLPIAAFMSSVAVAGLRYALLPRWLATTTGVLAIALCVGLASLPAGSVGFLAIMLGLVWFIAVSGWLIRRPT